MPNSDDDDDATTLGGSSDECPEPLAKRSRGPSPRELLKKFKAPSQNMLDLCSSASSGEDTPPPPQVLRTFASSGEDTPPPPQVLRTFEPTQEEDDIVYGYQQWGGSRLVVPRNPRLPVWEDTQSPIAVTATVRQPDTPEYELEVRVLNPVCPAPFLSPKGQDLNHLEEALARRAEAEYASELAAQAAAEGLKAAADETGAASKMTNKCWPHMQKFVQMAICVTFLDAVDNCHCTSELAANNNGNVKGNKWTKLHDHCHGGSTDADDDGSSQRGLLAGQLAPLQSASKMKTKTQKLWAYVAKEGKKHGHKIPKVVVTMCRRQNEEYEKTKADDKEAGLKKGEKNAELKAAMDKYQVGQGAMPPGAKGIEGTGRREHSTNLRADEPATYSWANTASKVSSSTASVPASRRARSPTPAASVRARSPTPAATFAAAAAASTSRSKSPTSSLSTHVTAESIGGYTNSLERVFTNMEAKKNAAVAVASAASTPPVVKTPSRRDDLKEMLEYHMNVLNFLRPHKDCPVMSKEYEKASLAFAKVNQEIAEMDSAKLDSLPS